jgi:hypothetical protein
LIPDHIGNIQKAWFLNADYDALFFKDPFMVDTLSRNLSARILYLPECFNPARLRAPELTEEDRAEFGCDIATAENVYGHFNYFGVSGNFNSLLRVVEQVRLALYKWLCRRSQRKRLTWERFADLLRDFPLPEPRIRVRIWGA